MVNCVHLLSMKSLTDRLSVESLELVNHTFIQGCPQVLFRFDLRCFYHVLDDYTCMVLTRGGLLDMLKISGIFLSLGP